MYIYTFLLKSEATDVSVIISTLGARLQVVGVVGGGGGSGVSRN